MGKIEGKIPMNSFLHFLNNIFLTQNIVVLYIEYISNTLSLAIKKKKKIQICVSPTNFIMLVKLFGIQFSSVAQSRWTICDPMNRSTPGLPVHH